MLFWSLHIQLNNFHDSFNSFEFDLIFGLFFTFWSPIGLFLGNFYFFGVLMD